MKILLLGSGGREHALAWKLAQSPILTQLYIAPGNAGTRLHGTNIPLDPADFGSIRQWIAENPVDMVIPGPEEPLVRGIHDFFASDPSLKHIPVIGPGRAGAMLEGSKDFAKGFMTRHQIPTARYRTFDASNLEEGKDFLRSLDPPYVLKADGLAAGKGVIILSDETEAIRELETMILQSKFGEASARVVIEEFLSGIELSVFVLTDGKDYLLLPEAKDYKRIGEKDSGPNTGGMGSVSPVSFAGTEFMNKVEERIIRRTLQGLQEEEISYQGFIFFGLINCQGEPKVIEYNCRLGDPETESVLPRISNDLLVLFQAVACGQLGQHHLSIDSRAACTVMLVSGGYPGSYAKGKIITGLENCRNGIVFHAGTTFDNQSVNTLTSGGRVVAVTALGNDMSEALAGCYENAGIIDFEGKYYRRDIGFDLC